MSFDLEFRARTGTVDVGRVHEWLAGRSNWRVEGASAVYDNDDTGVYFVLDVNQPASDEPPLVALINYYRPSFFVREIELELRSLVAAFGLVVFDPQNEQTAPDGFDAGWLTSRWDAANRQASPALATDNADTMSTARLAAAWSWNYQRNAVQESYGEDVFVPGIIAIRTPAGTSTAVVWTDAIPLILPDVGYVIVFRNRLAPRRLLRAAEPDAVLLGHETVVDVLRPWSTIVDDRLEFRVPSIPPELEQWVQRLPAQRGGFSGVAWDQVHDIESMP